MRFNSELVRFVCYLYLVYSNINVGNITFPLNHSSLVDYTVNKITDNISIHYGIVTSTLQIIPTGMIVCTTSGGMIAEPEGYNGYKLMFGVIVFSFLLSHELRTN